MLDFILDLIYPPVCGLCGKLSTQWLCPKCAVKLKKQAVFYVDDYSKKPGRYYDEHLYIFTYEGAIRTAILNYKFYEKAYLYKTFVKFLLKNKKFVEIIKSYDIIVPVPLSKERKRTRGYNQSSLIAREISKKMDIECNQRVLKKSQNIVAQSTLNKEEREKNIQGAYMLIKPQYLQSKRVLIIDDIYTTGSTVNECSKEILKAKPKKIGVLTIAKD